MIDLRSDTATKPTVGMRAAMTAADVGDDMVREDPTVNRLEQHMADLLGKEAGLFVPSGTMSNQIGIRLHCNPGDELLIERQSHIVNFEAGAAAALSGIMCRTLDGLHGQVDEEHLVGQIKPINQHLSATRLVCVENTTNMGGGIPYPLDRLRRVGSWCRENGVAAHMDGARLFNACVAEGYSPAEAVQDFATVSICFSKGLGAPIGSILLGSRDLLERGRRVRKMFGGAMRQAGVIAAAAQYAVDHHVDRLAIDHQNARRLADGWDKCSVLTVEPDQVRTNILFADVDPAWGSAAEFCEKLHIQGVGVLPTGGQRIRACTHLDISEEDVETAIRVATELGQTSASATE